jgi:hypothetical protein
MLSWEPLAKSIEQGEVGAGAQLGAEVRSTDERLHDRVFNELADSNWDDYALQREVWKLAGERLRLAQQWFDHSQSLSGAAAALARRSSAACLRSLREAERLIDWWRNKDIYREIARKMNGR